ncbi:Os08g0479801 [Oryza sativa Japonica Group]|uniref:Os08g0479801 protein n=1 Tax=Oryza sativa subsp. japonica TaxID=39947 RepID=A0A0P0XH37_ORYSJ|nr:Os08g0479801 [Oryza sativa Japonica Group]
MVDPSLEIKLGHVGIKAFMQDLLRLLVSRRRPPTAPSRRRPPPALAPPLLPPPSPRSPSSLACSPRLATASAVILEERDWEREIGKRAPPPSVGRPLRLRLNRPPPSAAGSAACSRPRAATACW